ncbi:MAG: phosphate ABC transporter permease PstA [Thaumarchaeota archaeon]|nr:phosphate ABC transporter permease PstA [Nitrososphaerota archaeon]
MVSTKDVKDSLLNIFATLSFTVVMITLLLIVGTTIIRGIKAINLDFFFALPNPPGQPGGGILNAIVGSLILVVISMSISIPVALAVAIYLYRSRNTGLKELIRVANGALGGTPSIVAGVFVYLVVVVPITGFSALAGALALSFLATPAMVSIFEEALKLVPHEILEAAVSLGVEDWKVLLFVIVREALPMILSGILIALGRIIGETAPLIFTAFGSPSLNLDPTQPTSALPLLIYNYAMSPWKDWQEKAWGAAFVLTILELLIYLLSRRISKR